MDPFPVTLKGRASALVPEASGAAVRADLVSADHKCMTLSNDVLSMAVVLLQSLHYFIVRLLY